MRICVVGLRGIPGVLGGVETHCEQLFPRLKKLRPNDAFTIIARAAYVPERLSDYEGLRVVALAHARTKHFETITNAICGVLYAKFVVQADLLHLHGIGPALTAPLAKALGMKVVITYHSKNYEHRKWNVIARWALRAGELCAVLFGDRIIAISPSLSANLQRRFPQFASKICFIPNGADHLSGTGALSADADRVLAEHGLERKRYILSVGRLVPEKGFDDLIEAFKAADLDCKLVIAGDANQRDAYANSLLQQACDKIIFTGFLNGAELQPRLQNASLFVLPSHNEGLPIAALEAAVAGAPLLLSDISANRDLGLASENYFQVGNRSELRRKLAADHEQFRVDCNRILQRYSWCSASVETSKLYSSLQKTIRRDARFGARGEPRRRPGIK